MTQQETLWRVHVTVTLTSDGSVILLRPHSQDNEERPWQLPSAPLPPGTRPAAWACQVAAAQVNLSPEWLDLVWAEVREGAEGPVLLLHYSGEAPDYPSPGSGVAETRFFQVEHLPHMEEATRGALYATLTGGEE